MMTWIFVACRQLSLGALSRRYSIRDDVEEKIKVKSERRGVRNKIKSLGG